MVVVDQVPKQKPTVPELLILSGNRTRRAFCRAATAGKDRPKGRCAVATCDGTIYERRIWIKNPNTQQQKVHFTRYCSHTGCRNKLVLEGS